MAEQQTQTGSSGSEEQNTNTQTGSSASEKTFTQSELDRIVQDRLSRDRQKYSDYEDLRNKVSEFEKHKEQLTQQELEKKQEYEKLKDGWSKKEQEYQAKLNEYNTQLQSERIGNALTGEILKKNAYPEAAQLLKPMVKYNTDGTMTIRGKDANGIDTDLPIEQGVEQFLKDRPYLVKGSAAGGGGTGQGQGTGQTQTDDGDLGRQLQDAMAVGDRRKVNELKLKIKAKHSGINIAV